MVLGPLGPNTGAIRCRFLLGSVYIFFDDSAAVSFEFSALDWTLESGLWTDFVVTFVTVTFVTVTRSSMDFFLTFGDHDNV